MRLQNSLPLLVLSTTLLAACGSKAPDAAAASAEIKPVLTVELVAPRQESWPGLLEASGHVAAWQEASIGSELSGVRLEEVLVNVGDSVSKGQLLARYNEDSLQADLARLDAALAESQAALDKAKLDSANADRLEPSGALSKQDILAAHTQAAMAEARVASARAARNAQALRVRYARIVAPDDGVISARSATVGAVSAQSGTELFRLIRRGRLEWRAEVRADALPHLKHGTRATIRLPQGATVTGTIRQLAPSVSAETLNGIAYVDLPANSGLAAGMFVSGSFDLPASDALSVPESALVFRNGNRYVMQVDDGHRVHEIKVQTGRRHGSDLEIVAGIDTGARVALSGGAFLNDGDLVNVAKTEASAK